MAGTGLGLTQLMLVTGFNRQLGLSDELFALADTALLTVLGQVAFMPLLVLAARICPQVWPFVGLAGCPAGGVAGWGCLVGVMQLLDAPQ